MSDVSCSHLDAITTVKHAKRQECDEHEPRRRRARETCGAACEADDDHGGERSEEHRRVDVGASPTADRTAHDCDEDRDEDNVARVLDELGRGHAFAATPRRDSTAAAGAGLPKK